MQNGDSGKFSFHRGLQCQIVSVLFPIVSQAWPCLICWWSVKSSDQPMQRVYPATVCLLEDLLHCWRLRHHDQGCCVSDCLFCIDVARHLAVLRPANAAANAFGHVCLFCSCSNFWKLDLKTSFWCEYTSLEYPGEVRVSRSSGQGQGYESK